MDNTKKETPNNYENRSLKSPEISNDEKFFADLKSLDNSITELLNNPTVDPTDISDAWEYRAEITEKYVDSLQSTPENPKIREIAQFDIMVDKARIFEQSGNLTCFLEELDCAEYFALNEYLDDLVDISSITDIIDAKVDELGMSFNEIVLKLRKYISFENREFLKSLIDDDIETDDFIGDVYGMIADENEDADPDEILASLGLLE